MAVVMTATGPVGAWWRCSTAGSCLRSNKSLVAHQQVVRWVNLCNNPHHNNNNKIFFPLSYCPIYYLNLSRSPPSITCSLTSRDGISNRLPLLSNGDSCSTCRHVPRCLGSPVPCAIRRVRWVDLHPRLNRVRPVNGQDGQKRAPLCDMT